MNQEYLNLIKQRRSIYALGKDIKLSDQEIVDLLEPVISESPTAFNSQTTRAVFLFGQAHDQLWDIVIARLKSEVPNEEAYAKTVAKLNTFKAGHGTIMYFTDMAAVHQLEKDFVLYKDNFYDWSEQAQGIMTMGVWTTLANNGIGASLQHYNPLIDEEVAKAFNIPANWRLRAEMPFGSIEAPAAGKDYMSADERFRVIK
ncbi:nitroreductase family protein [Lapidilactobacillus wuchangensis]|uniref:nitroreductase family protein n=1 Tax=Lapidilactobacillus wuchangensis TaxID=2486001 RepID=UPI000F7AB644|nr:nitroreductase family protein [Lapidilactobacillus wuchangensis]